MHQQHIRIKHLTRRPLQTGKWEEAWDMNFNSSKWQVLHVTRLKTPIPSKFILHNTELESVSAAKYLGVIILDDLNWGTHADIITIKANQTLGYLKSKIKVHNQDLKSAAYKILIWPQLEYISTVWSPHGYKLESVQRSAARWATRDYGQTSSITTMHGKPNRRPLTRDA